MTKPFKNIAVAIAFSPQMEANIYESVRLTHMLGEKLFLIHVEEKGTTKGSQANEPAAQKMKEVLTEAEPDEEKYKIIWEKGEPVEAILRVCKRQDVDLLLAGAIPKEGLFRYYMGSVARKLVRKSQCSILLITNASRMRQRCSQIVVNGIDHPKTEKTIATAMQVGEHLGADRITVVQELQPDASLNKADDDKSLRNLDERRKLLKAKDDVRIEQIIEQNRGFTSLPVNHRLLIGRRGYTIGHYTQQENAGLLVVNSPDSKLKFMDRLFAHDLEYILSDLPSPILIVR